MTAITAISILSFLYPTSIPKRFILTTLTVMYYQPPPCLGQPE